MKLKSEYVGWLVTGLYILGVFVVVYLKRSTLPCLGLNEIGDFLAGVFGPLAFLWLVLGYLQQGRELKLSSEALRMQADELKASVEQQTVMARAATDQLKAQQLAFELQVWRHEQEISANFDVLPFRTSGPHQRKTTSSLRVTNRGHDARCVVGIFDSNIGVVPKIEFGDMKHGATSADMGFGYEAADNDVVGNFYIEYLRSDDKLMRVDFDYTVSAYDGVVSIKKVAPKPRN